MSKIKNYNPILGIRLNDLKMLTAMSNKHIAVVLSAIRDSVYEDSVFVFPRSQSQYVYDTLMRTVSDSIETYDKYLIEDLGYTRDDINEYHREEYEKRNKEEKQKPEKVKGNYIANIEDLF